MEPSVKVSPHDHKKYRPLNLKNGLRVLLIHNNESQKSAAALAVNVGHFSDPDTRQGLAHFLEHMLFLGTEKYPDGSEYQKFISQFGGSNNAWTATEHTCFFFDIHNSHFAEAIDRFSRFFYSPLLSESFVNKERKNIDAEFKLKLKDDIRRLYDVHKETINSAHPFSKFSVGNTETLADRPNSDLTTEVSQFFGEHYVAQAMTLVLEGPQSLDELEELADSFSLIKSAHEIPKLPNVPLYLNEHQQVAIEVAPVKNDRQLIISFALPGIDQHYRKKPEALIAYLIGHEGPNSILSVLKKRHWAISLTAGSGINGYNFKDFNISIRLTPEGEANKEEIITLIFSYIALLKSAPIPTCYYQEKSAIANIAFTYHEKTKPIDSVCQLVINMQHYPAEDYIYGDYVMDGMDQQQIEEMLSFFTTKNMRYTYVSQKAKPTKTSRWYQVPYSINPIDEALLKACDEAPLNSEFSLPTPNSFVVANPVVHPDQENKSVIPERLIEEDGLTLWYKQDQTFKVPKGYLYISIDSPSTLESIKNIVMTRLFC